MSARGQDIVSIIKEQIKEFGAPVSMTSVGSVIEVGDGIA
ncbi:ATP synthase subunit alpha, partial [Dehalococcoides mccartyi]